MSVPRREFAWQCLGLGAASLAAAAEPPPPALPDSPPSELQPPTELLILSALVRQYPSEHYTQEALRGIQGDIAGDVARGKTLRAFPLKNSDAPALTFRADRAEDQGAS
jgi:hypothetical protein